jgi:hypothetical protein
MVCLCCDRRLARDGVSAVRSQPCTGWCVCGVSRRTALHGMVCPRCDDPCDDPPARQPTCPGPRCSRAPSTSLCLSPLHRYTVDGAGALLPQPRVPRLLRGDGQDGRRRLRRLHGRAAPARPALCPRALRGCEPRGGARRDAGGRLRLVPVCSGQTRDGVKSKGEATRGARFFCGATCAARARP